MTGPSTPQAITVGWRIRESSGGAPVWSVFGRREHGSRRCSPDRSGPRVDIDQRLELAFADRLLPAAPVVEEVLEIQTHGLPVVGDEPIGPGQGVEMLVPELALHRWIEPSSADARVGRTEQGQGPDAVGMTTSQGLGDGGPDVLAPQQGKHDLA